MKLPIFILSDSVQSGKTTLVERWLERTPDVGGILTPDKKEVRQLIDIASGKQCPLQLYPGEEGIKVGRFVFSEKIFERAREILLSAIRQKYSWVVIDEIGKLEVHAQSGLEPAAFAVINYFKQETTTARLLLIIRDSLLDEAIDRYGLKGATILPRNFFDDAALSSLNGIVLCGGESSRMGIDKAFIQYHNLPQYAHVYELLRPFCQQAALSINRKQSKLISDRFDKQLDKKEYADAGPLTGLLTAFSMQKATPVLVAGCDYPYLKRADLLQLVHARANEWEAICFLNEENYAEPLLAIYEASCAEKLEAFYQRGGRSLQQFLKQINTKFIRAKNPQCLTSIDDAEKRKQFTEHAAGK